MDNKNNLKSSGNNEQYNNNVPIWDETENMIPDEVPRKDGPGGEGEQE